MNYDQTLLLDKPRGWTSFDVVAKIRGSLSAVKRTVHDKAGECGNGIVRKNDVCRCKVKVGHTGTLDPLATGLLVILTGKNTTKAAELTKLDKTYEVEMTLGYESETGDAEGNLTEVEGSKPKIVQLNLDEVTQAIESFIGQIEQTPPTYSAIKINGQRAYKLAREGKKVDMPSRRVTVYDLRDVVLQGSLITFTVDVSSGTYIRTLVQDIGTKLGTGAYMSNLRRTKVGDFDIKDALTVEEFTNKQT